MKTSLFRSARCGLIAAVLACWPSFSASAQVEVSAAENVRPALPFIPERTFLLTKYGAVGDGKTLNTQAFKTAIAAVEQSGGGKLIVPPGVYRTLPFELCSKLDLHLEAGAVIQAPGSFAECGLPDPTEFKTQDEVASRFRTPPPLITGHGLHDVMISGPGTIDGNGAIWWAWSERAARAQPGRISYRRPHLIVIDSCERLALSEVTLTNSPMFHFVPRQIFDLTIDRVKVRAPFDAPNTDAIDPGPVTQAWIHDCEIDTGDDDIVIKSGGKKILIENCTIRHGHGISIGSGTTLGISDMLVRHCTFDGTDNGIRIKSMRGAGGPTENVRYTDIQMKNVEYAIVLDLTYTDNNRPNFKGENGKIPSIQNILIDHVTIQHAKHAGRIVGLPEKPIRDVILRDVTVNAGDDFVIKDAEQLTFERVEKQIDPLLAAQK